MVNTISKPRTKRVAATSKSKETKKIISKEDIRSRAYEIYLKNETSPSNELDHWLHAERELRGYNM
jgi:hypothetical protein